MPVNTDNLDASLAAIRTLYKGKQGGSDTIVHMGDEQPDVQRIPFTSPMLNFATAGGLPLGRISRFYGGFSSGKSLTCWDVIANAQKLGMTCVYYNIEKQFEPTFTANTGVDISKLVVMEGTTIEGVGTKLEHMLGSAHLHVLDSCSSAVSIEELNAKVEDWTMGLNARVWGKVLRRTMERLDQDENAVLLVDQIRDVFGGRGDAVAPPGGRFIEHTSSLTLYFKKAGWLFRDSATGRVGYDDEVTSDGKTLSEATEPEGIEITARVEKNRVGRPFRSARMRYDFGRDAGLPTAVQSGLDVIWEIDKAGKHFGITKAGGGSYKRRDDKPLPDGSNSKRGRASWLAFLESDEAEPLRREILQAMEAHW